MYPVPFHRLVACVYRLRALPVPPILIGIYSLLSVMAMLLIPCYRPTKQVKIVASDPHRHRHVAKASDLSDDYEVGDLDTQL